MNKIWKLLWIIFVLYMVFFIISDEKWIKYKLEDGHIVKYKIEKNLNTGKQAKTIYKSSNMVHINPEFENPKTLRKGDWVDLEYIAKLKKDRKQEEKLAKQNKETNVTMNMSDDIISDIFDDNNRTDNAELENKSKSQEGSKIKDDNILNENIESSNSTWSTSKSSNWNTNTWKNNDQQTVSDTTGRVVVYYDVNKYSLDKHELSLTKWARNELVTSNIEVSSWNSTIENEWFILQTNGLKRYQLQKHSIPLNKGKAIKHNFVVDNTSSDQSENKLSDHVIENLLKNEEIDIDTLESENDEFLQKVFQQTRDKEVMNLIVENYLNEYQFVKAKKFIDNLPEAYVEDLNTSLHLRVAFNSFSLSSKNASETLTSLVQDYKSKNKISNEDANRYLWVLALMNQNYERFFEISASFTSEKYKAFSSKLLWYKNQISKQMWMPQYYFDTLVSLELFNQWLFQPAKVLALYSLQKNSTYILPYQILAYANFLTNSWDTSIEYLKKLIELDPNNAEKYRFLMWVAYYRNEKYGQSAIMLSMIKNEKLRLDAERYLIRDYLYLNQSNKLISSRNKLLWYENLVASDFYTYFYEAFFHPYAEWQKYEIYTQDVELANKMLRVCSLKLTDEEKVVCMYWSIWKNIAIWSFELLEQSLLKLVSEYPQWYLYHALWEYYIKQWDLEKAKAYLLKAVSSTQKAAEKNQIKKLLENTM